MNCGARLADAAEAYVGVPFRLHGRDPQTGLDCVGLVAASLAAIGRHASPPRGYRLRNSTIESWLKHAFGNGFLPVAGAILRGDLLLTMPGPAQHHLMIAANGRSAIHAHAGLRRAVIQPLPAQLNLAAHWRLAPLDKDN